MAFNTEEEFFEWCRKYYTGGSNEARKHWFVPGVTGWQTYLDKYDLDFFTTFEIM